MDAPHTAEVALDLVAAWNARDWPRFLDLLTDDAEWYDPAMPEPPLRGRTAIRGFCESVLHAFPDFTYEVRPPICVAPDGSRCAVPWRITATHRHALVPPGYAPTGRTATLDGVDVLDFRDGKVCRVLTAFDIIAAAEQLLGMRLRPAPGSWRARIAVTAQRLVAAWARRQRA